MAPKGFDAVVMGLVFAFIGLSNHFAAQLGALSKAFGERKIFTVLTIVPVIIGLVFIAFNNQIIKLTHEDKKEE